MDLGTDLEFTVPDLVQGKEYLFKVCARNKCGPGEPAYVDEPVNMSAPASKYLCENFLPSLMFPVFFPLILDLRLTLWGKGGVSNMDITS